eukprot:TRINITY_DN3238_c0_g1_i8.p1 TRINITY_DN3238_c0_g1~~TRINITY_DN3238_c0_g1_i8.p1  ORF type:complete len:1047 (+),score=251.90 TRINITY_DN3238_c0_g1_i8:102-3242(+)
MIRRPPRSTLSSSSAASDVYKRQVHGVLEYCIDLFERESMQWFVRHLQTLLESISMAADVPISELNVIPDAERDVLLEQWSGVQRYKQDAQRFPSGCVHELIGQQVQRTPGNRALSSVGESELTYSELWALSSDVGCVLRSKGVAEGCIVALMVDRSVHMVVAMIGIHAAGAAYAPFAPKMPQERLSFMAEDCRTVVVLTTEKHYELGRSIGVSTVLRMGTDDMVAVGAPGEGVPSMSQQLTALCLYTSGSTGKPKAVLLSHAAVVSHLDYIVTEYGYTEDDKYLQSISYTFVASLPELFGVLLVGGSVLLSAADSLLFLDNMAKYIRDEGITLAQFIPSVMSSFIETETLAESVRCLVLTGEPLPVSLLEKVMEMSPRLRILNHYGCTEVTDTTTVKVFSGELSKAYKNVPVGKPVKHRTVMILDSQRRPVPLGAPGELWVGGVGCATAYLNQPKLTEEKFVRGLCGFERLYATGDLVRWRPDGDMECLGRIDLQVKINGLRIELGEIEGVLMSDPDVQEAVVLLQDKLLVAYASPATEDGGKKLLEHCRASLPGYMVPVAVIGMDDWPRNANGKLDRRALPRFAPPAASTSTPCMKPSSPLETELVMLWASVLGLPEDEICVGRSFKELGGQSLMAGRLSSRLRKYNIDLSIYDVLKPEVTITRLANVDETWDVLGENATSALPEIESVFDRGMRAQKQPVSNAQAGLFLLWSIADARNRAVYNEQEAVHFRGHLSKRCLRSSLRALVHANDMLRATFSMDPAGNVWQQIAKPPSEIYVQHEKVNMFSEGGNNFRNDLGHDELRASYAFKRKDTMKEATKLVQDFCAQPLDLENGPCYKFIHVSIDDEQHIFGACAHHILIDGWSWEVFWRQLGLFYDFYTLRARKQALDPGCTPTLLPEFTPTPSLMPVASSLLPMCSAAEVFLEQPLHFYDFVQWQTQPETQEILKEHLQYWVDELGTTSLPVLELPLDKARPPTQSFRGERVTYSVGKDVTDGLKAVAKGADATMFTTLLVAFQVLLCKHSRQDEVAVSYTHLTLPTKRIV